MPEWNAGSDERTLAALRCRQGPHAVCFRVCTLARPWRGGGWSTGRARTPPRWPSTGKGAVLFAPGGAVHCGFAVRDRALGRARGPEPRKRVSS
jgi:hypothetical protein